jgi:probable lipoprotein NlpC
MICKKGDPPKIISSFFPGIALVMIIGCAPSIRYTNDISEKRNNIKKQSYSEDFTVPEKAAGKNLADLLESVIASYIGSPYRAGGTSRSGFDCSGFVYKIYKEVFNIELPRTSWQMKNCGKRITLKSASAGDLVFFRNHRNRPNKPCGQNMGGGRFAHASFKHGVIYSNLNEPYYQKRLAMIRRIFK